MTGNKEVMKRRLQEGRGQFPMDCPITDSKVSIHFRCASLHHRVCIVVGLLHGDEHPVST